MKITVINLSIKYVFTYLKIPNIQKITYIMSQNLSFNINIPEESVIQIGQDSTFENFIGQFQKFCPTKLLCIIDGTYLKYYDKPGTLPTNIRFDYKQRKGNLTEYYFRDIDNDSLYCVFGHEAAKIFYPRIDDVDPTSLTHPINTPPIAAPISKRSSILQPIKEPTQIVIIDKGIKLTFSNINYPLEVYKH